MDQEDFDVEKVGPEDSGTDVIFQGNRAVGYLPWCSRKPRLKRMPFLSPETAEEARHLFASGDLAGAMRLARGQPFLVTIEARLPFGVYVEKICFLELPGQPCGFLVRYGNKSMATLMHSRNEAMSLADELVQDARAVEGVSHEGGFTPPPHGELG